MRATRGPIPVQRRLAIPVQKNDLAEYGRDKITPAERSDKLP
ncbi:hypothetical protein [Deinococcus sp. QL22]|nr:hypothetical protein [Deinococcus sp. QL22]